MAFSDTATGISSIIGSIFGSNGAADEISALSGNNTANDAYLQQLALMQYQQQNRTNYTPFIVVGGLVFAVVLIIVLTKK